MTLLPAVIALFVSPAVAALVYVDARRHGLSQRRRTACSLGVGLVSFAGFLGASLLGGGILAAYYGLLDQTIVAVTPLDLLLSLISSGFAVTALALLGYGVASRLGPLGPT